MQKSEMVGDFTPVRVSKNDIVVDVKYLLRAVIESYRHRLNILPEARNIPYKDYHTPFVKT